MEIPRIVFCNNVEIPALGLGTWRMTGEECFEAVKKALELGYVHIDTAEIYRNEEEIGKAIKESGVSRDKLFITSKFWSIAPNLEYEKKPVGYDGVLKSFEGSVKKLQTDYLDLYLTHWPNKYSDTREILKAFKKLYDEKKIKAFGVSNYTIKHLKEILPIAKEIGLPIVTNQVEFHVLFYQKELLEFCKENDIIITAYYPLVHGEIAGHQGLEEIGKKYGKSASQIALKWLLQKGTIVIPKSKNKDHLQENLEIFDFELSEEDVQAIDNLNENKRHVNPEMAEFG
jgi:diketogulonate reductase-like aldo/keto reductase